MNAEGARPPAVFLDRDGTVMEDLGYLADPAGVRLLPGVPAALARLHDAGFLLVVVTNQSGVARGLLDAASVDRVNERLRERLRQEGVALDGVYVCPHAPDAGCACRKPAPGLLLQAARDLGIDLPASYMVGDKVSDAEAGRAAGCHSILLGGGGSDATQACARDVAEAVERILQAQTRQRQAGR